MMLFFATVLCGYEAEWKKFKIAYGKNYTDVEDNQRYLVFRDNMNYIALLNRIDKSATYGVTKYADLSSEEFLSKYANYVPLEHNNVANYTSSLTASVPDKFDWTEVDGVVNPVQDQGSCGSCWAFGSAAALESAYAINHNILYKLSEQQLVDCNTTNSGCDGGNLTLAATYLKNNGVTSEDEYPYAGVDQTCKTDDYIVKLSSYEIVSGGEDEMREALYNNGPLVVAINANPVQFYVSGVLHPSVCSKANINHAVVAVGYDVSADEPYWKIRNSWSSSWGEDGYFRLYYGDNTCGIEEDVLTYYA